MEWLDETQHGKRLSVLNQIENGVQALFQPQMVETKGLKCLCLTNLAFALIYFMSGRLGLLFSIPGGHPSPLWPPSGVALGAVMLMAGGAFLDFGWGRCSSICRAACFRQNR